MALSKTASAAAAMDERRRIMYEIHDGILQSLATLILRVESCRTRMAKQDRAMADELEEVEELTRSSMREIRNFLAGNTTQPLQKGALMDRLRDQLRYLSQGLGLEVILESSPENLALESRFEREIYLVLREGLTNVTKHSHASKAEIYLSQQDHQLTGTLKDDGVGFNLQDRPIFTGLGLSGMEERIRKLGGEIDVKTSPGMGTSISFKVPVPDSNALH